jgi:hypothetical protein
MLHFDRITRSAEAMSDLKTDEVRALWLRAEGYSYAQIAARCSWSVRKVKRLLVEGRRNFTARYAALEAGESCAERLPMLVLIAAGEGSADERKAIRLHLKTCGGCRGVLRELRGAPVTLSAVLPAGAVVGVGAIRPGNIIETVFATLHERAAGAVVKAQVAVDAVSGGKIAAVAASAAAVAGGGTVAVQTVQHAAAHNERPAPVTASQTTASSADPSAAGVLPASNGVAVPVGEAALQQTGAAATTEVFSEQPQEFVPQGDFGLSPEFQTGTGQASPAITEAAQEFAGRSSGQAGDEKPAKQERPEPVKSKADKADHDSPAQASAPSSRQSNEFSQQSSHTSSGGGEFDGGPTKSAPPSRSTSKQSSGEFSP